LRTTFIFRFRTLTNNLNFLTNQNTYKMTCDSKINLLSNAIKTPDIKYMYYVYHGSYELIYLNQRIRRMSWFK